MKRPPFAMKWKATLFDRGKQAIESIKLPTAAAGDSFVITLNTKI